MAVEPQAVWWGSANWTQLSPSHLEVGFARDDPALVREAADFVADVIAVSEPVDITCVGPEPNLVPAEFDDAAMAEAAYDTSPISKGWTREEGRPVHYPRPRDRARRGVCWTKRGPNMALTGQDRDDVIRGLRAKSWSLDRQAPGCAAVGRDGP